MTQPSASAGRAAAQRDVLAVVAWMAGALLSFSAVAVSVRQIAGALGVFEMLCVRNLAGVVILLGVAAARPQVRPGLRLRRPGLHLVRNVVHFLGQYTWVLGLTLLPMATVFAIEFTVPAWVALLAVPLLGERLTGPRIAAVALGFLGVLVIVRPGTAGLNPAALIVLAGTFGFAGSMIATKRLTRSESTLSILFWMNVMQAPMNFLGSDPWFLQKLAAAPLLPLAGLCLGGLTAHWCLTSAFRRGDAAMVVPLDFLRLPLIAGIGFWFYAEPLDPLVFAGSALIIAGILWNVRAEAKGAGA